jgi:beta-glucanase (GH16 family)
MGTAGSTIEEGGATTGGARAGAGGSGGASGGVGGASVAGGAAGASGAVGTGGASSGQKTLCADTSTPYKTCQSTDFSKENIFDNPKWQISTWGNANRTHSPDNLWVANGVLAMKVTGGTPKGQTTTGAEFSSTKTFLYGSFRTTARTSTEPGTVNSPLFYYLSDTSEIDVEILSQDNPQRLVNYTIHENNMGPLTHQVYKAAFDPSADFHEYRFDWSPAGVTYYIDGKPTGVTLTGNVPYRAGRLMVNHWTLSDPGWGGGPPLNDAFMYVKYIEIYYND